MPLTKQQQHDEDVLNAQVAANMAKTKADLEANDPGSTDPNRTDNPMSDGKPMKHPGISNDHKSPF
jgi:hypothetical protein